MTKQTLSIEQIQHLQELGLELKKDTILVWARFMLGKTQISDWEIAYNHSVITENSQIIPAYTLQDVLDALPKEIMYECKSGYKRCWLSIDLSDDKIEYYNENAIDKRHSVHFEFYSQSSLIDAAYELFVWCIEHKFVETNKNK